MAPMHEKVGHSGLPLYDASLAKGDLKGQDTAIPTLPIKSQVHRRKMIIVRNVLLLLVSFSLLALSLVNAGSPRGWSRASCRKGHGSGEERLLLQADHQKDLDQQLSSFEALLAAASPDRLHEQLHKHFPNAFKHGVWPSEADAMSAVHRADAALATSLVQLAKRQDGGNGTTTTTTSAPPPSSTQEQTTPPESTTTPRTSSTSANSPSTTSPSDTTPVTTTRPPSTTPSLSVSGSVTLKPTTSTFTSTNADGGVVVVTATTWVPASQASGQSGSSTQPAGSLQTGAAAALDRASVMFDAVMGAAVLAGALLV